MQANKSLDVKNQLIEKQKKAVELLEQRTAAAGEHTVTSRTAILTAKELHYEKKQLERKLHDYKSKCYPSPRGSACFHVERGERIVTCVHSKSCGCCKEISHDCFPPTETLPCRHRFHLQCLKERNVGSNGHIICPICKRSAFWEPNILEEIAADCESNGGFDADSLFR